MSAGLDWIKKTVCEETEELCETTTTSKSGKTSKTTKSSKGTKVTSKSAKSGAGESDNAGAKDGVKCAIMHDNSSKSSSSSSKSGKTAKSSKSTKSSKTSKSSKSAPCVCAEDEPWQLGNPGTVCFRDCAIDTGETKFASRKDCCATSDNEDHCLVLTPWPDDFDSCTAGGR